MYLSKEANALHKSQEAIAMPFASCKCDSYAALAFNCKLQEKSECNHDALPVTGHELWAMMAFTEGKWDM